MNGRHHAVRYLALAVMLVLSSLGRAAGQDAATAREARTLFERGIAAAQASELAEASTLFERSLALLPRPATAYNLAMTKRRVGQLVDAIELVDELLDGAFGDLSATERSGAEALHAQIDGLLGTLRLVVDTQQPVQVRVDGRVVAEAVSPIEVRLDPGPRALRVSGPGGSFERDLEVAEGSHQEFRIALEVEDNPEEMPLRPSGSSSRPLRRSPWLWVVVGAVAAGTAVGLGVGLSGRDALPDNLHFGQVSALSL